MYFYGHAPNWSMVLLGRLVESSVKTTQTSFIILLAIEPIVIVVYFPLLYTNLDHFDHNFQVF